MGACTDTTELDVAYLKKVNIDYSKSLWTHASQHNVTFVYASSAATYGGGELGYVDDENQMSKLKPLNPYGESKLLFDLWALDQEKQGVKPPAWAGFKFFNVYGFGERHKNKMASVIVHAFDQIRQKGSVKLFKSHKAGIADGHQQRDFVYVQDVVKVLEFARTKPITRGIYNLGSGKARTFLDLVRATFHAVGKPENIDFIDTPLELRERYQYFTEAEMAKLKAQGYATPFTPLEEGVTEYVARLQKTL
jgi:ADP-L-glycero-D-manno-heptose 6-epimerase